MERNIFHHQWRRKNTALVNQGSNKSYLVETELDDKSYSWADIFS